MAWVEIRIGDDEVYVHADGAFDVEHLRADPLPLPLQGERHLRLPEAKIVQRVLRQNGWEPRGAQGDFAGGGFVVDDDDVLA